MCYGPCTVYQKCGHHKHTIESLCRAGKDANNQCNAGIFTATRTTFSTAPSLCVHCYRRYVDQTIARYQLKIKALEHEIKDIEFEMALAEPLFGDSQFGDSELAEIKTDREVKRGELIDERHDALEAFRTEQGVWGDGEVWQAYWPFGVFIEGEVSRIPF